MEARKLIKLTAPEEVQEFVDAKSFLGVLSLVSHPVMIFSQGSNSEFDKMLEKYAVV